VLKRRSSTGAAEEGDWEIGDRRSEIVGGFDMAKKGKEVESGTMIERTNQAADEFA